MVNIPKLKKKIGSFLTKEDGKISKEKLMKTGILLSIVALGTIKTVNADHGDDVPSRPVEHHEAGEPAEPAENCPPDTTTNGHQDHCNNPFSLATTSDTVTGTHGHAQHGSHSSHGSHGSHGSHTSW